MYFDIFSYNKNIPHYIQHYYHTYYYSTVNIISIIPFNKYKKVYLTTVNKG